MGSPCYQQAESSPFICAPVSAAQVETSPSARLREKSTWPRGINYIPKQSLPRSPSTRGFNKPLAPSNLLGFATFPIHQIQIGKVLDSHSDIMQMNV